MQYKNRVNTVSNSATEGLYSQILQVPESPSPPMQVPTSNVSVYMRIS